MNSVLPMFLLLVLIGGALVALLSVIAYLLVRLRDLRVRVVRLEHAVQRLQPDAWRRETPVEPETGIREGDR